MSVFPSAAALARCLPDDPVLSVPGPAVVGLFRDRKRGVTRRRSISSMDASSRGGAPLFLWPHRPRSGRNSCAHPAAPSSRHLRDALPRAGIPIEGEAGVHAARAFGASRAGHRQVARSGTYRSGARRRLAPRGAPRPMPKVDGRLCPGHRSAVPPIRSTTKRWARGRTCCACTPPGPTGGNSMG